MTSPLRIYLANLSPASRASMRSAAGVLLSLAPRGRVPWRTHSDADAAALAEAVRALPKSAAYRTRLIACLRGILRAAGMPLVGVDALPKVAPKAPRPFDLPALLAACGSDLRGARTRATMALLAASVRRQELPLVAIADLDPTERTVSLRGRRVPMGRLYAELAPWITLRGPWAGSLLCPLRRTKTGTVCVDGFSTAGALVRDVHLAAKRAGVAFSAAAARRWRLAELSDVMEARDVARVRGTVKSSRVDSG